MWHKPVVHLIDIRLRNNAGIDFPLCHAGAKYLDLDKTRLRKSNEWNAVTCARCKTRAPRRYPWARYPSE